MTTQEQINIAAQTLSNWMVSAEGLLDVGSFTLGVIEQGNIVRNYTVRLERNIDELTGGYRNPDYTDYYIAHVASASSVATETIFGFNIIGKLGQHLLDRTLSASTEASVNPGQYAQQITLNTSAFVGAVKFVTTLGDNVNDGLIDGFIELTNLEERNTRAVEIVSPEGSASLEVDASNGNTQITITDPSNNSSTNEVKEILNRLGGGDNPPVPVLKPGTEINLNGISYDTQPSSMLTSITDEMGVSLADLYAIAGNAYWANRSLIGANGGHMYLYEDGDTLNITTEDNDPGYTYVIDGFGNNNGRMTVTESESNTGGSFSDAMENAPIPVFKPDGFRAEHVEYTNKEGATVNYLGREGNTNEEFNSEYNGQVTYDSESGNPVIVTREDISTSYIPEDAMLNVAGPDGTAGLQLSATRFFDVLGQRAVGVADFIGSTVAETLEPFVTDPATQFANIGARIAAGLVRGQSIEETIRQIAIEVAANGVVTETLERILGKEINSMDPVTRLTATQTIIQQALVQFAVTAALNADEFEGKDYLRAAVQAGIDQSIIVGANRYFGPKHGAGGELLVPAKLSPAAINGGVTAALIFASSIINGQGVNAQTVSAAAAYGAASYASTVVSQNLLGLTAASPVTLVIGVAFSAVVSKYFEAVGGPGEFIYHTETVASVTQPKEDGTGDYIIGVRQAGALLVASENRNDDLIGTDGHDVLVGQAGKNVVVGKKGDDMLEGRDNDDVLQGGEGHDHIEAGKGNDYVEGNDGHDRIYGDDGDDIILAGEGSDVVSGGDGNDSIEGEAGNDRLFGDAGNDVIIGGQGDDVIHGGADDDILMGEAGEDVIEGGSGNDTITGGDDADIIYGGEGSDNIEGNNGDDVIAGEAGIDMLNGGLGNDVLDGGADNDILFGDIGDDVLFGGEGNDTLYGEFGNDYIMGGKGTDTLRGGDGTDVYVYVGGDGHDTIDGEEGQQDILRMVDYRIENVSFQKSGDDLIINTNNSTDSVTIKNQLNGQGISLLMLADGRGVDLKTITFDEEENAIFSVIESVTGVEGGLGTEGVALLFPTNDTVTGANQQSTWHTNNYDLNASGEYDNEYYNNVQVRVSVWKETKKVLGATVRTVHHYTYYDYYERNLTGTDGNDRIVGLWWAENLKGLGGDDQLYGNGGGDTLDGGGDDDLMFGGSQNDTMYGRGGMDKMYGGVGNDTMYGNDDNDTMFGEWDNDNIYGGRGDDLLAGGEGNDNLYGENGADILFGDDGGDTLEGGKGDDYMLGGKGDDTLRGGKGNDIMDGADGTDTLEGGKGNDYLIGGDGGDILRGGDGDDILQGDAGADTIDGGEGQDTVSYTTEGSAVTVNLATGEVSGSSNVTGDTLTSIEGVIGTAFDDTLTGDDNGNILKGSYGNDVINGGKGNDHINGGAGADTLIGGEGDDTLSYQGSDTQVTVNLATNTVDGGHASNDTISGFENIEGSDHSDTLTGTTGINEINAGKGDDTITGNGGDDVIDGGEGTDTFIINGNQSDYNLTLESGVITIEEKVGSDKDAITLRNVENIQFNDNTVNINDFPAVDGSIYSQIGNTVNGTITQDGTASVSIQSNVRQGNVSTGANGSYTYTPPATFIGNDKVVFEVTNASGLKSVAHVDIYVATGTDEVLVNESPNTGKSVEKIQTLLLGDGNIAVVWDERTTGQSNYQIQGRIVDANGNMVGNEFVLQSDATSGQRLEKLLPYDDGGFLVAFSNSGDGDLYLQEVSNAGKQIGMTPRFAGGMNMNIAQLGDDKYMLTYQDGFSSHGFNLTGAYVAHRNEDGSGGGAQQLDIFTIEQNTTPYGGALLLFDNYTPIVTSLHNGDVVVTWISRTHSTSLDSRLHGKVFGPNGGLKATLLIDDRYDPNYGERRTHTITNSTALSINDTMFVVLWVRNGSGGSAPEIYGKMYKTDGTVLNGEFRVNTTTSGHQQSPQAFLTGDNAFTVVWESSSGDGNNYGSFGQKYTVSNTGHVTRVGNEFQINQYTENNQYKTSGTATAEGKEFFAWASEGQGGEGPAVMMRVETSTHVIKGTNGNDELQGSAKDETFILADGIDDVTGGGGKDTVDYSTASAAVTANLTTNTSSDGDSYTSIENLTGSDFDDLLRGSSEANTIKGGKGDDTLEGKVGDDILDGGEGNDTAVFSGNSTDYDITIDNNTITVRDTNTSDGDEGTDTLTDIEHLQFSNTTISPFDFIASANTVVESKENTVVMGQLATNEGERFTLQNDVTHGTLSLQTNGGFSYIPNTDYTGTDQFTYTVTNTQGLKTSSSVTLQIAEGNQNATNSHNTITGVSGAEEFVLEKSPEKITTINQFETVDKLNLMAFDNITSFGQLQTRADASGLTIELGDGQAVVLSGVTAAGFTANNVIIHEFDRNVDTPDATGAVNGGNGNDTLSLYSSEVFTEPNLYAFNSGSPDAPREFDGSKWDELEANYKLVPVPVESTLTLHNGGRGSDLLEMSDKNEAVFLDVFYGTESGESEQFLSSIEYIDAGGGHDLVDLTSDSFSYGNVAVNGGTGNDVIWTSSGNDTLIGGRGADILYGGTGSDTFRYINLLDSTSVQTDIIDEFDDDNDIIDVAAIGVSELSELSIQNVDGNTIITTTDTNDDFQIKLLGEHTLDNSNFAFSVA